MSRKKVADTAAVVLTLGILASPVRAELVKLTDEQMDKVTAGAFTVGTDPNLILGYHSGSYILLQSFDNGATYIAGDVIWRTHVLYISTIEGFAVGILSNPQGQYWDGELQLPPNYIMTLTQIRPGPTY